MSESVDILISSTTFPQVAHHGDAGADLQATQDLLLMPGHRATVGTGVSIALPEGYLAFIVPRSGLAAKHGITVVNSPGTVDAGYRGEIKVTLLNTDMTEPFDIKVGDRIAQMIVMPFASPHFIAVDELPESERGAGGFGSSGVSALPKR